MVTIAGNLINRDNKIMKKMIKLTKFPTVILVASALGICSLSKEASATPVIEINSNASINISGSVLSSSGRPNPAVYQVFAGSNECLRVLGTSQAAGLDLEATLVAPSGRVWQNDDDGGAQLPFIKAITPGPGWHTLHLAHFSSGNTTANGAFTVNIARLPSDSSLCSSPTTPNPLSAPARAK